MIGSLSAGNHERPDDPDRLTWAHIAPFAVFMGFMVVLELINATIAWDHPEAPWWRRDPAHFIYPVQSLSALALLFHYRRSYTFNWSWKWSLEAVAWGAVGIAFWLLPTTLYDYWNMEGKTHGILGLLGVQERRNGFDASIFDHPMAYGTTLAFRFLRAVVVVALVEEIFWRGFVMRFINDMHGYYWKQPFGKGSWKSYWIVTALFVLAHSKADYAGAFVYGTLTYLLCVRSKSLGACVVMHAVANLLMGIYIITYEKHGLW